MGAPLLKREGVPGFMLRLIEDIVSNHQGEMKVEVDPKRVWILFSLKFPVERRRKMFYGPSGND